MISLVVCSINKRLLGDLRENIDKTIGVEHEWLIWDNEQAQKGICHVYNMMAAKARFPFICFLHEDILIDTTNWGNALIKVCEEDNDIGLIGVAGGKYKSQFFSGWYSGGKGMDYYSLIHRMDGQDHLFEKPLAWRSQEEPVVSIDGLFMFCYKSLWQAITFNESLLKGFHYYDIDFSLRAAKIKKVVVTNRLRLFHITKGGDYSNTWLDQTILYHQFMKDVLPFSIAEAVEHNIDITVAKYWLDWLKNKKVTFVNKRRWIRLQQLYKYPGLWYSISKFLLYEPLRLQGLHQYIKSKRRLDGK